MRIRMHILCSIATVGFSTQAKAFTTNLLPLICDRARHALADALTTVQWRDFGVFSNLKCTISESLLRVTIWFRQSSVISIFTTTSVTSRDSDAWHRWNFIALPREKFHPAAQRGGIPDKIFLFFSLSTWQGALHFPKFCGLFLL